MQTKDGPEPTVMEATESAIGMIFDSGLDIGFKRIEYFLMRKGDIEASDIVGILAPT